MTIPTQDRELLEQANEALMKCTWEMRPDCDADLLARWVSDALRTRLAQPDAIGAAGGEVPEGWTVDEITSGGFRIVRPSGAWILVQNKPADGWNIVWEFLDAMFNRPAAPKSGDMAQGEQEASGLRMELATAMRYIEERDERIKELKAEIANLRFAIERIQTLSVRAAKLIDPILARAAASTGAVPATDASDEVWAAWDAKHSTGAGQISDTARLDWMQNHLMTAEGKVSPEAEVFSVIGNDTGDWQYADTLRDAIDAAIAAAQPKGDGNG